MAETPVFHGEVDAAGAVHLDRPTAFRAYVRTLRASRVEVVVRKHAPNRSVQQNRWYWGVILAALADHTGYTPDDMHAYCKQRFLEPPERKHLVIADAQGEYRDEAQVSLETSTTRLTTAAMAAYCEQVRMWAAADLGINVPSPDEC